jgi:hypothetical protein
MAHHCSLIETASQQTQKKQKNKSLANTINTRRKEKFFFLNSSDEHGGADFHPHSIVGASVHCHSKVLSYLDL